jgi:hypothetical protein
MKSCPPPCDGEVLVAADRLLAVAVIELRQDPDAGARSRLELDVMP